MVTVYVQARSAKLARSKFVRDVKKVLGTKPIHVKAKSSGKKVRKGLREFKVTARLT